MATVVLRGSTDTILDLERAVDDGVRIYKVYLTVGWNLFFDVLEHPYFVTLNPN